MSKYCIQCGQIIPDSAKFCSKCGIKQYSENNITAENSIESVCNIFKNISKDDLKSAIESQVHINEILSRLENIEKKQEYIQKMFDELKNNFINNTEFKQKEKDKQSAQIGNWVMKKIRMNGVDICTYA